VLAFAAAAVDDPTEPLAAMAEGAEVYAHPAPALAAAQALAAASGIGALDGDPLGVVVVVFRDDETWGAGCGACFRPVGDVHVAGCVRTGPVMPHEAVVRPAEQLTPNAARV
jgi:hypothetical protein